MHVLKPRSFRRTVLQKCGRDINCSLGCGLHPSFCNPNQNRGALWRIVSSNESAPANSKTGFYADRDPNKQEVGVIFCMKRLETLMSFQISKIKNKKLKTYNSYCPFKGLSKDTTLMQIQSGQRGPLKPNLNFFGLSFSFRLCRRVGPMATDYLYSLEDL